MAEESASRGANEAAPPNTRNIVFPYLGSLDDQQAEMIFTRGKGFDKLPSPTQPIFVLMIGTPGSGKSTALARLPELVGLNPDEAVQISLDSLIESLEPFREKTTSIAMEMLRESGYGPQNDIPEELVSAIASKTSGPYLSYMRAKKNNRPGRIGKPLPMSMNEMRYALLDRALTLGKNIIYERTISDASKDTLREEVFAKIAASRKPYKIFVVYTKIDDEGALRKRLYGRPLGMMKRSPPFFRGVPASMAGKFISTHEEYFNRFLRPLASEGVQLITVFWDGRPDEYMPSKAENVPKNTVPSSSGGRRRQTKRKIKKIKKSRRIRRS